MLGDETILPYAEGGSSICKLQWLIVGLGNPGERCALTRHNVGFMVVDRLANRIGAKWKLLRSWQGMKAEAKLGEQEVVLLKPLTYMNLSGLSVRAAKLDLGVGPDRIVVVVDDADLPLGAIRLRPGGSDGGHRGLRSVMVELGTDAFPRQRIGIGKELAEGQDLREYVLSQFRPDEWPIVEKVCERGVEQLLCLINDGIEKAMSRYNGRI